MSTGSLILFTIGFLGSFMAVFWKPRHYFIGLFKPINDEDKSEIMYLVIVIIGMLYLPLYYILDVSVELLNLMAVSFIAFVFIWKMVEIFKVSKAYFSGLFKKHDDVEKTSLTPLSVIIFSLVVIISYFLK